MSTDIYIPNRWVVIKIDGEEPVYKVFAMWSGGYLDGDSWQLNSGIVDVVDDKDYWDFIGHSGSVYHCRKTSYDMTVYGAGILTSMMNKSDNISIMDEDTDWENLI